MVSGWFESMDGWVYGWIYIYLFSIFYIVFYMSLQDVQDKTTTLMN